jgi:sterol desaturase/sphingolipid hydroxylase (fatty acid hydroxylase superfamily)
MHRIHHTPTLQDTNSNYGTILTLWDRLFGSFRRHPPDPVASFGVETLRDPRALGIARLLALPFTLPKDPSPRQPPTTPGGQR